MSDMFAPLGANAQALMAENAARPHGSTVYVPPERFAQVVAEIPFGLRIARNDGTVNVLLPNGLTMRMERL